MQLPGATPLWSSLHFPGCAAGGPSLQSALGEPLSLPLLQDVGITSGVQAPGRDVLPRSKCGGVFQAAHPSPCPALGEREAHQRVTALPQSCSLPHSPSSTCHPERWGGLAARPGFRVTWVCTGTAQQGVTASQALQPRPGRPAWVGVSSGLGGQLSSFLLLGVLLVSSCVGMSRVETSVSGRDGCDRSGEARQGP